MGQKIVFPFKPQDTQQQAALALSPYETTKINGFGGPKYSGKSYVIQYLASLHGLSRPLNILIIGHKFEDIKSLHIEPLQRYLKDYIDAGQVSRYHATNKLFRCFQWDSVIKFQQVTNDSDARSLNGQAWDLILIDEAQKLSPFALSYLQGICRISHTQSNWRKRLRMAYQKAKSDGNEQAMTKMKKQWDDTYYSAKMLYCFNWGEKGHTWLKRLFWDGCKHSGDPFLRPDKFAKDPETGAFIEDPKDYRFIFAPMEANKAGLAEDPGYVNRIKSMDEPYRTAYLTGNPEAFAGLMFEIHPHVHEVDMDGLLRKLGYERDGVSYIPDHWSLIGAVDPGTQDYCAASLYAKTPEGVSYQLTDYYVKGRSHEENAEQIVWDWRHCPWTHGRMPDYTIAGKDAFARQSKNAIFGHEYTLKDVFWDRYKIYLVPAITDRVAGAQALHMALKYKSDKDGQITGPPKMFFAKQSTGKTDDNGYRVYRRVCEPTIEEIVSLESNPKRPEDIVQDGVADHAFDKIKYYLLGSRRPPALPPDRKPGQPVRDYGRQDELAAVEDADYEDISSFSEGSIADFAN